MSFIHLVRGAGKAQRDSGRSRAAITAKERGMTTTTTTTTTAADTDGQTWTITGFDNCDAVGCHNRPIIIAAVIDHDRFCETHLNDAARVALHYKVFPGWYRVTDTRTDRGQLVVEAYPL